MSEMSDVEVNVKVGDVDYSARLVSGVERRDGATKVSIYRTGRLDTWIGAGWWNGVRVEDCAADLGDETYDAIDSALRAQVGAAS